MPSREGRSAERAEMDGRVPRNAVIHNPALCTWRKIGMLAPVDFRGSWFRAASALVFAAVVLSAGCDAHSKPIVASPLPSTPVESSGAAPSPAASRVDPPSPAASIVPSLSDGVSPSVGASTFPAVPSELASKYPDEMAKIPDAVQTVRNFFDGVNHEIDTGDEAAAIATFTPKCQLCGEEVYSIKQLRDGGYTLRGGHLHLISVDSAAPSYSQVVTVYVTSNEDALQQIDGQGNVVRTIDPAVPTKFVFDLELDVDPPKIWMVTRVGDAS